MRVACRRGLNEGRNNKERDDGEGRVSAPLGKPNITSGNQEGTARGPKRANERV